MLITVLVVVVIFVSFQWFRKRRELNRRKDSKPDWAIGYARYFLCDVISRVQNDEEVLSLFVNASRKGLPDLNDFSSQSTIVGLKAYANSQGDLSRLNDQSAILSLSQAVAVEAQTALQMAASRPNIDSYLKEFDPNISDAALQDAAQDIFVAVHRPILTADGKRALCELLRHYLMRFFERQHGKPFYEYATHASQKLAEGAS
ncbi:hypothetical protein [Ruegeria sp. PrR005]|uniref:Uncharacterized protein n=1 Tax=Ruegeria sp. PrR005 TaxID=2706882 RepID=A0A6B2NYI3_9RHOB|nr:hypothetical protein [Ruegeria sp. PrR005]NDW47479.1 hypothetical protein [Ruegeria sp. PrR005]